MNKEKQIEEMAKDLATSTHSRCIGASKTCGVCDWQVGCLYLGLAKTLVDKGYRKASEVAREIFEEIEKSIVDLEYQAKTPRKTVKVEELKALCDWILHEVIPKMLAELKKKYIGKDTNVTTNTEEGK